jgi:ribosomal protein S18 acetylase RimI-like enzyme
VACWRGSAIPSGIVITDGNGVSFPPIRRLGSADLKDCVALAVGRGWSPEKSKWALLLEVAEAFGVDAPDGGLAGSVVLARYGRRHASVGMMLVAARFGRRGLGHALMSRLLAEAGNATVTLFATDAGKPLYEKLGFRTIRRSAAFVGTFRPERRSRGTAATLTAAARPAAARPAAARPAAARPAVTRPATETDMAAILDVDKAAFGADRSHIVGRLPVFAERLRVLETSAGITGYAAAWRNEPTTVIGPVVAPDRASARLLIADLAAEVRGPLRLDLDPDDPELPGWADARGLSPASRTAVMVYGEWNPPGHRDRLFTPISVALS